MAIGAGAHGDGAPARRFDAFGPVLFGEPQQTQAGSIALLRVRPTRENLLDERGRLRADTGAPPDQTRRAPLQMRPVRVGHVLGDGGETGMRMALMDPDPRAALKHSTVVAESRTSTV